MFTGIIQNLGTVIYFEKGVLEISTSLDLSDCEIGSSICCNGVCLTATEINYKDNVSAEIPNLSTMSPPKV